MQTSIEAVSGFDINSRSGVGYTALKVAADISANLTSGAATKLADMPSSVRAFAVGLGF